MFSTSRLFQIVLHFGKIRHCGIEDQYQDPVHRAALDRASQRTHAPIPQNLPQKDQKQHERPHNVPCVLYIPPYNLGS